MTPTKAKDFVKGLLRRFGFDIVRYAPDAHAPMNALGMAVEHHLLAHGDFFFIQIGANDGRRSDPFAPLVKKHHLRGILVEPLPDIHQHLKENYAGQDGLIFEQSVITTQPGEATLYRLSPDAPIHDEDHGRATLDKWRVEEVAKERGWTQYIQEERVPALTLPQLLEKHGVTEVSLLMLDTEGHDYEIIKMAFDAEIFPRMIYYEFVMLDAETRLEARRLLIRHGYKLTDLVIDTLAVREEHVDAALVYKAAQ